MKAYIHRKTGTQMVTAGLPVTAKKTRNNPKVHWQMSAVTSRGGSAHTEEHPSARTGSDNWARHTWRNHNMTTQSERPLTKKVQTTRRVIQVDWSWISHCLGAGGAGKIGPRGLQRGRRRLGRWDSCTYTKVINEPLRTPAYCRSIIPQ